MKRTTEQRLNVKFCVKLQKSPSETLEMLTKIYGEHTMSKSNVFKWPKVAKETTYIKVQDKKMLISFFTSEVSSTLNLYPKGPLLIRRSTWRC
jgi:hypothetical protein